MLTKLADLAALLMLLLIAASVACTRDTSVDPETAPTTPMSLFAVGPEMVSVPYGAFTMGDGVAFCGIEQREVTLTHSFYLGKYEVTNQEYRDVLQWAYDQAPKLVTVSGSGVYDNLDGSTVLLLAIGPSQSKISFSGGTFTVASGWENHPVVFVSWYGAAAYCDWLSMQMDLNRVYSHTGDWPCNGGNPYTAQGYRLPTDAEWEYAAQYDDERIYPWGDQPPDCGRANFKSGTYCVGHTTPVGSYAGCPAVGADSLYDMAGNVWEWCNDWHVCSLGTQAESDPVGPSPGSSRVLHGGSWYDYVAQGNLRCALRNNGGPSLTLNSVGFRCARSAECSGVPSRP